MFNKRLKKGFFPFHPAVAGECTIVDFLHAVHFELYLKEATVFFFTDSTMQCLGCRPINKIHLKVSSLKETIMINIKVFKMLQALNFKRIISKKFIEPNANYNKIINMIIPKIIAFYFPQFHEITQIMNGGVKDLN
jgi:hypothetical protein